MTMTARIGNYHLIVTRGHAQVTLRKVEKRTIKSRRHGTEREGEVVTDTWHGSLEHALNRLISYEFDAEDTATMNEMLVAIQGIKERIETWTVELENEAKANCGLDRKGKRVAGYGDDDDNEDS